MISTSIDHRKVLLVLLSHSNLYGKLFNSIHLFIHYFFQVNIYRVHAQSQHYIELPFVDTTV